MADSTFRQRAYNFYLQQGFQPHQAAALAGQAEWESGGNATASHDKGTGFGLFGWRNPSGGPGDQGSGRWADLVNWAKANNLDPNAEDTQLKFSVYELNNNEKAAGDALRASTDITGATNAVIGYLRPQGWSVDNPKGGHGYQGRLVNAAEIAGSPPPPMDGTATATAAAPPPPTLSSSGTDVAGLLAKQQADKAEQEKESAAQQLTKEGMGLLGKATTPAPEFEMAAGQVHRPQPQPFQWLNAMPDLFNQQQKPDFNSILAQQRLMRRA